VSVGDRYDLRWSTARGEVKLRGHASLASAYMVLTRLEPKLDSVRFETRHSGLLVVRKDGELLSMDFPALFPEGLRKSAGATDLRSRTGPLASKVLEVNDTYIAVYEDESTIQTMQPDFARLEQLHPFAVSVRRPDGTWILFRAISSRVTVCPKIRQPVPCTAP
jgi:predicted PhzF superfamily epimerase YddE/YHI9